MIDKIEIYYVPCLYFMHITLINYASIDLLDSAFCLLVNTNIYGSRTGRGNSFTPFRNSGGHFFSAAL